MTVTASFYDRLALGKMEETNVDCVVDELEVSDFWMMRKYGIEEIGR